MFPGFPVAARCRRRARSPVASSRFVGSLAAAVLLGLLVAGLPLPSLAAGGLAPARPTGGQPSRGAVACDPAQLCLARAEALALRADPRVAAAQAAAQARVELAVAAGSWSDPQITSGLFNLPTDSFDVDREGSTQLRFGIRQALPRGSTLRHRRAGGEALARAERLRARDLAAQVQRDLRVAWLEAWYQARAREVLQDSRGLFRQLLSVSMAHYANGQVQQQDVLRAQVELARLEERLIGVRQAEEASRAELSRWLGDDAGLPFPERFPPLPELPGAVGTAGEALINELPGHPAVAASGERIAARMAQVRLAREQFKPGINVGLEYRKRFGRNSNGSDRPDMLAAMVTVDAPLFPKNRQSRRLAASQAELTAARQQRDALLLDLRGALERELAAWRRLDQREALFDQGLTEDALANAEASLHAYQNGVSEFNTLVRARLTALDLALQRLRLQVERGQTQARLLYLTSRVDDETAASAPPSHGRISP